MNPVDIFIYALVGIACTFLTAWIFAIVFGVSKRRDLMEMQIQLLCKIAEKNGATEKEIKYIIKDEVYIYPSSGTP